MIKLSPEERETHLWIDQAEKHWSVYTDIESHRKKFRRLGWPENHALAGSFRPPDGAISFRKGRSTARIQAGRKKGRPKQVAPKKL